jgi:(2Fe-2S) ferredoxin
MNAPPDSAVAAAFRKMNLLDARQHVFLCVGPNCCTSEQGLATWEVLKQRIKELDLPVLRTKAACLRVCCGGPWMVVYPEGAWYGAVTPERCERIVTEHLVGGRPVSEWLEQVHPLAAGPPSSAARPDSVQGA